MSEMHVNTGGGRQEIRQVNYPSNSKKSQVGEEAAPERTRPKKIITGEAVRRSAPLTKKVGSSFLKDSFRGALESVVMEVLIPAAKEMFIDGAKQTLERLFYGSDSRPRPSGARSGYTNYSRASQPTSSNVVYPGRTMSRQARATHSFDEIVLPSRGEAEDVLDELILQADQFGDVSVADLYSAVGLTYEFTDNEWGWLREDMKHAGVHGIRGGYVLVLPRTRQLARP